MATAILQSFCNNSNTSQTSSLPKQASISSSTNVKTKQPISKLHNSVIARRLSSLTESGQMHEALSLFQSAKKPDTFIWNVMIRGYTNWEMFEDAIGLYYQMQAAGVRADHFTFPFVVKSITALSYSSEGLKIHGKLFKVGLDSDLYICNSLIAMKMQEGFAMKPDGLAVMSALEACSSTMSFELGKEIHGYIIRQRLDSEVKVRASLIDMYCKCANMFYAERQFNMITERNVVTWNLIIGGYAQNGQPYKAVDCFTKMQEDGEDSDSVTMVNLLPACAQLRSKSHGKAIHGATIRKGFTPHLALETAVIDMYAKCGELRLAKLTFDRMVERSLVTWNTMITGYVQNEQNVKALRLFLKLLNDGDLEPDDFTISSIIPAYAEMKFLRDGKQIHKFAAERIFALEHDNTGCYVLLSNMYADAGRWEDVERMRLLMKEQGLHQTTGKSTVELDSKSRSFVNGDKSHDDSTTIYQVLQILSREIGEDAADSITVFKPIDKTIKENSPRRHSVRLAITSGLISSTVGSPVLVKKNVRICVSCHNAIKLISKFTKREIIVGDSRIYHHFTDGFCSCGDYW
ncbi:uncharacterized protein A4U43_C04F21820 [Asparagus officinalis]|uniref:DYW domain-containing protein n=1 Tax=Asparagus officinalis TaxID=4686 RepID=A0A5P1F2S1_ASPOF|nr:uncharacterized protein A4U43_C04F21820 [Asparagus officinalis]